MEPLTATEAVELQSLEAQFDKSEEVENPFHITPIGLEADRPPSLEEWEAFGQSLMRMIETMPWVVGDWMIMGEAFGDEHANAMEFTGHEYDAVTKYKHVAKHVPKWVRRDPSVIKWTYHKHVANLDPEKQDFYLSLIERQRAGEELIGTAIEVPLLGSSNVFYHFVRANEKVAALSLPEQVELDWADPKDARNDADLIAAKTKYNPKDDAPPELPDVKKPDPNANLLPPCPLCGGTLAPNHCRDCSAGFEDMAWTLHNLIKDVQKLIDSGELSRGIRDVVFHEFDS